MSCGDTELSRPFWNTDKRIGLKLLNEIHLLKGLHVGDIHHIVLMYTVKILDIDLSIVIVCRCLESYELHSEVIDKRSGRKRSSRTAADKDSLTLKTVSNLLHKRFYPLVFLSYYLFYFLLLTYYLGDTPVPLISIAYADGHHSMGIRYLIVFP